MEDNECITMLVRWSEQLRLIDININDDINSIEKTISNTYQLQQVDNLQEYQLQYYDSNYQRFIDLYPETFRLFQQHLHKLLSSEPPPKTGKEWILKIVSKTIEIIRRTIHESINDDTYNYQQENDRTEIPRPESTDNMIGDIMYQNNEENQQEVAEINDLSPQLNTINRQLVVTPDHPCGLGFDNDLADYQRQQYESEMIRKSLSKKTLSGVRLLACQRLDETDSKIKPYPTVHFKIPNDKLHLAWSLHLYILTEADKNGIHYLHASKSIYNHDTKRGDRNSESVNPYVAQLSQDDLRDGKYEIQIKVCNMKNLPTLRNEQLREFFPLNNSITYHDRTLLPTITTCSLELASEKYHLACILCCGEKVYDQCISNLTIAVPNKKRDNNDRSRNQEDGSENKKKK